MIVGRVKEKENKTGIVDANGNILKVGDTIYYSGLKGYSKRSVLKKGIVSSFVRFIHEYENHDYGQDKVVRYMYSYKVSIVYNGRWGSTVTRILDQEDVKEKVIRVG